MKETKVQKAIADHYGPMTAHTYDTIAPQFFWSYQETMASITAEVVYGRFHSVGRLGVKTSVLDLGIGTGNLSVRLLSEIEKVKSKDFKTSSQLVGLDASPFMMDTAREKFKKFEDWNVEFKEGRLENVRQTLRGQQFDCIVSAFAIHHLDAAGKASLIEDLFELLNPGGVLVIGDRMPPEEKEPQREGDYHAVVASKFMPLFEVEGKKPVLSEVMEELRIGFREDGDQPSTVQEHLQWMKEAGFMDVRSPFFSFGCAVVSGIKI